MALRAGSPIRGPVWNKVPDAIAEGLLQLPLDEPERSLRELSVQLTEEQRYCLSQSTESPILKSRDLITALTFIVIKAVEKFENAGPVTKNCQTIQGSNTRVACHPPLP